ncbi:hypothetical protein MCAP1_002029 [Malassezia caprae]|uniref:TOG domain-containing protein n=1 Tax=Malassezia caprae TaxID=1381934 RepID=A0AAF0IWP3_9BASI|nr:hypothetical protein MCAP1_002029 [Malassezia caprae]
MADTAGGSAEDVARMPLGERLSSKLWKARLSAYEELTKSFSHTSSDEDPIFADYARQTDVLQGMALDANAAAQEKGVECLCAFVRYGGTRAGRTRMDVLPGVADKCLGSMRTGTRKAAQELVLLYAEQEDVMGCDGLISDLCDKLASKQPKVVAANVNALALLVQNLGGEQVNTRLISQSIPRIFAHADKNVRSEGNVLAVELHRTMVAALAPVLSQLKDIQVKELERQFSEAGPAIAPSRHLASNKARAEAASGAENPAPSDEASSSGAMVDEQESAMNAPLDDPYETSEPVNVLASRKLSSQFFSLVASTKWQERMEALDSLHAALQDSPRIQPDPGLDSYVQVLQLRVQKDVNINVVLQACRCLSCLAQGLRKDGAPFLYVLPAVLERLKERKPTTLEVLSATLDSLFLCGTLCDVLEPVMEAAAHKNPSVKSGTLRFLARCLQSATTAPSSADIKTMASMLLTSLGDGAGDVRDAAAHAMGTLLKLVGERPMAPFMEQLDDIKRAKVQEEAANVTLAGRRAAPPKALAIRPPSSAPPPSAARGPSAPLQAPSRPQRNPAPTAPRRPAPPAETASARAPSKPIAARASPQKSAAALSGPNAAASRRPATQGGATQPAVDEAVSYRYAPEEGAARALELVPETVRTQLASSSWKERLEGAQSLVPWIRTTEPDTELVAHLLARHPGWKESNFQVMNTVFQAMQALQALDSFGRGTAALTIPPLCEKLGDIKLKATAGETLMLYAEATSFGFVLAQAVPVLSALKAPKAQADALLWVNEAVLAFGLQGVNTKALVSYTVASLKSANASVRTNATILFGSLARFVGRPLLSLVSDVTPQLMATLEAQVASAEPAPAPTRATRTAAAPVPDEAPGAEPSAAEAPDEMDMDDLIPRVPLETLVSSAALQSMGDSSWKIRKESLETVQSSLQSHPRLQGQGADLVQALKPRLQDTNIMVRTLALDTVSLLARGLQKHFEPLARTLSAPVVQVLADAKAPMRAAAAAALDAMVEQVHLAPLIPGMGQVLDGKHANPMLRQDLFQWLIGALAVQRPPPDLAPLVPSILASLDDRSGPVRKGAQALLPMLLASVGYKALVDATGTMKGASRATALPLLEAARSEAARQDRSSAAATPAASGNAPRPAPRAIVPPSAVPSVPAQRRAAPSAPAVRKEPALAPVARVRSATTAEPPRPKASAVNRTLSSSARASELAPPPTPFLTCDGKYKAARERASRTPFVIEGAVRARDIATLRQQMETCCVPTLVARLFSQDHHAERDYLQGLDDLMSVITDPACAQGAGISSSEVLAQVCANSDVLLKYACVRLLEKNTSVALKCFELVGALLDVQSRENTPLGDAEAQALILTLVVRTGDAKAAFREAARDMLKRVCVLFPPSRLFQLLLEHGLSSKNARTRSECLTELGYLLARHGLAVCTPAKSLPVVARHIGDRDPSVRGAALSTLAEAYKLVGEGLWRLLGPLPPKDESLLEERLKRTSLASPARAAPARELAGQRAPPTLVPRVPQLSTSLPAADDLGGTDDDVAQVSSDVKETSIAGLKSLQARLPETLTPSTRSSVVQALLTALQNTSRGGLVDHRYVKHVLQTLLVLLDTQHARAAPLDVDDLAPLLQALLRQLMHISALDDEASQTLAKQLNAVVLRVLSTCSGDAVYAALFQVLTDGARTLSADSDEDARFVELVVKCLWKVARKLPAALETQQVHGAALLVSVEQFLQAVPPAEWGRRAREHVPLRDIPLITATNVLKQLTDVLGEGALALTDSWDEPENSHVYRYLLRLLYGSSREGESTASSSAAPAPAAQTKNEPKESAPVRQASSPTDDALTAELRGIFDRISQKDQSRAAIRDLYEYQKRHPSKHASIERSLQNTGPIFQRYIKRALANHAAEDQTPAPTLPSSSVDARLAELKAKFRREPSDPRSNERIEKRMSMSTEALRTRLAAMRTDDAGPGTL